MVPDRYGSDPWNLTSRDRPLRATATAIVALWTAAEKDIRLAGRPLGCAETHPDLDMLGYYPQAVSLFGLIDVLVMT
jgi:hypothetical protein